MKFGYSRRMRLRLLLLLAIVLVPVLHAQSTEDALRARLVHQPLYLRALPREDKLRFGDAGILLGRPDQTSPALSGIDIYKLQLDKHRLFLEGQRVGVKFVAGVPERAELLLGGGINAKQETIRIEVAAPPSGDYTVPLDAIFATGFPDLAPQFPEAWKAFGRKYLAAAASLGAQTDSPDVAPDPSTPSVARVPIYRPGGNVTPPRVLNMAEPEFNEYARVLKIGGNSRIGLVVDENGNPTRIRILRPIGLGMDEKAVEAVQRYRFKPAMRNGGPVPVAINIEVNFQIF